MLSSLIIPLLEGPWSPRKSPFVETVVEANKQIDKPMYFVINGDMYIQKVILTIYSHDETKYFGVYGSFKSSNH